MATVAIDQAIRSFRRVCDATTIAQQDQQGRIRILDKQSVLRAYAVVDWDDWVSHYEEENARKRIDARRNAPS
jgi:hypothetical protein